MGLLGTGAMGEVHRAYDTEHRRVVALKLLRTDLAHEPEFRARFGRESELAAGLNNPHVIPIHRYGEIDGRLYLDMRMVAGTDLEELLHGGPLDPAVAVDIVSQVADALDAAHAAGLVHRDVKPSNVLLTDPATGGRRFAYLCDFGVALPLEADDARLTRISQVVGTFSYMAPERFTLAAPDRLADVYSLACLLFTALTGQAPFRDNNVLVLMAAHGNAAERPRPSAIRPGLPPALDAVVMRGVAVDKYARFQSAGELAEAAGRALGSSTSAALPEGVPAVEQAASTAGPVGIPAARRATATTGKRASLLGDPMAWMIATIAGGSAWAVLPGQPLAVPIGLAVGGITLGSAVLGDALLNRR